MLLVGCGGEATPTTASSRSTTAEQTTATVSAAARAREEARLQRRAQVELERTFAANRWRRPGAVPPHAHQPLEHLIVREVRRGRGPRLRGDENVYVNYVKTYWRSGRVFLVAWGPLRADYFSLLAQPSGIRRGMIGMRPGGRRTIAIPERVADVHEPYGRGGMEAANIDVVLRGIVYRPES